MPPYEDSRCSFSMEHEERRPLTQRATHIISPRACDGNDKKTPLSFPTKHRTTSSLVEARHSKYTYFLWILLSFFGGVFVERSLINGEMKQSSAIQAATTQISFAASSQNASITYGHVHMAKTGGTTLNGELAVKYERICGHKGYSYDAVEQNMRVKALQRQRHKPGAGVYTLKDSFYEIKKGYNRGRVPPKIMFEIGFHNCDWISIEDPGWSAWERYVRDAVQKLELHVPCRDPIDHLLSMCNYQSKMIKSCDQYENDNNSPPNRKLKSLNGTSFYSSIGSQATATATATTTVKMVRTRKPRPHRKKIGSNSTASRPINNSRSLESQIDECMLGIHRFDYNLTRVSDDIKCFDFSKQEGYIQYMDQRLQKRKVTADYVYRFSDRARHKEKECLLSASEELKERVRNYLIKNYDYYHFCNQCMGGEHELVL